MHVWPVGTVVQCSLQPLDWGSLQRVGQQYHKMASQATAALSTHRVPFVGHSAGTWRTTNLLTCRFCTVYKYLFLELESTKWGEGAHLSALSQKAPRSPSDWQEGGCLCRSTGRQISFNNTHINLNHKRAQLLYSYVKSAANLVNRSSQTGQAGQTVYVYLTTVCLSSHKVGSVLNGDNIKRAKIKIRLCNKISQSACCRLTSNIKIRSF